MCYCVGVPNGYSGLLCGLLVGPNILDWLGPVGCLLVRVNF